ncbi:MAG: M16 family metallopeptidase [Hyphomonadaceae bacterium]
MLPDHRGPAAKQLAQLRTIVVFSGPGMRREDPDFLAACLQSYIIGGGALSFRLADDLREKRGLTYGLGTGLILQTHFWRWTGSTLVQNDKADEAVTLIRENIGRLGRERPRQAELDDAMAYVTGAFPLAFDSKPRIARNLLGFRQDNLAADYVQGRNACFEGVTLADLKRVAGEYMKRERFTLVLVGQPALD